jgi:hypothetical protein
MSAASVAPTLIARLVVSCPDFVSLPARQNHYVYGSVQLSALQTGASIQTVSG